VKKFFNISLSVFAALFIFACNLQAPTAVEIKGSPDVRFSANIDIGKTLSKTIKDIFTKNDIKYFLECSAPDIQTFIVGVDIIKPEDSQYTIDSADIIDGKLPKEISLPEKQFSIDFSGLTKNDIMKRGFKFTGKAEAKIFIKSVLSDGLKIELSSDGAPLSYDIINSGLSGINSESNTYTPSGMPSGGKDISDFIIPLLKKGEKSDIKVIISIPEGSTIIANGNISMAVEMVIWLPMSFEAQAEAEFSMPEIFPENKDLFGREKPNDKNMVSDIVENLSIAVKMNKNILTGATLIAESKGVTINNHITGDSLEFAVNEQDMKDINNPDNHPFIPQIKIYFPNAKTIAFPHNFSVTEVSFKGKLNYHIDLQGGN
jgi:hypothetical protein